MIIVVHFVFIADVHNDVELLSLLVLSSLFDGLPVHINFLQLLLFIVWVDVAYYSTPYYLLLALVVAEDAVLFFDLLELPHLARTAHLRQGHPPTLLYSY